MFVKLAVIACSLAAASAAYNGPLAGGLPAAQFPAGIDPKSCPNFPDCTNPAVAVSQGPQQYQPAPQYQSAPQYQPAPQYQSAPQYQAGPQYQPQQPQAHYKSAISQYNPVLPEQYAAAPKQQHSSEAENALNRGEYIGDGDYHGEGLAEALAPGYTGQQQGYNTAPAYNQAPQYNQAPAPQYNPAPAAQIPAGVSAQACPNYPYCH